MEFREDDLFTLASSVADLLGAPVTVEDTDTVVLAYSGGLQAVDDARIGTILGRRVPSHYRQLLTDAGVFQRMCTESGVIYVDLASGEMTPRAVIAVRNGQEMIGAIWAAVTCAPTPSQEAVLRAAVPLVARRMVLERERADAFRRTNTTRIGDVLAGGAHAVTAADELGLRETLTVAAIGSVESTIPLPARLLGSVGLHLDTLSSHAVIAQPADVAYAVIGAPEAEVRRMLQDYLTRSHVSVVVGIGRTVDTARLAHHSRAEADLVLAALRHTGESGVVAGVAETLATILALQSADTFTEFAAVSPLTVLRHFDHQHRAELVTSVRSYLDHVGDVAAAAAALHVHPNTLRNRLRRAAECGVRVDDPDTRLLLMLQLKLHPSGPL